MPKYIIPNVLHFIWFGNNTIRCKETLTAWRDLHSKHIINLWTSTDTLLESYGDIKEFCIRNRINIRDITETNLGLHNLITTEIKKERYWSASDIARFSILSKESGFYFDIGVKPNKPLPEEISCTEGFLLRILSPLPIFHQSLSVDYKIFCSAYKDHSFFKKILSRIESNFACLIGNSKIEEEFYASFKKENLTEKNFSFGKLLAYKNLTLKEQANYIFSRIMTGEVVPSVLSDNYHKLYGEHGVLCSNSDGFNISFSPNLNIPFGRIFYYEELRKNFKDQEGIEDLYDRILCRIQFDNATEIDLPLIDTLNNRGGYSLRFFARKINAKNDEGGVHLFAKARETRGRKEIEEIRNKVDSNIFTVGNNTFLIFPNIQVKEQSNQVEKSLLCRSTVLNNYSK